MIVIRIELWPKGDRKRATVLGEAVINNAGGDERIARYDAAFSKFGGFNADERELAACKPKADRVWKRAHVSSFDRKLRGPWDLLALALLSAVGDRIGLARRHAGDG